MRTTTRKEGWDDAATQGTDRGRHFGCNRRRSARGLPIQDSCYTFDNGQLNYAYTDVVIEAGGRYAVGSNRGNYTVSSAGTLSFTGTLSNASGKCSIKTGGKPQSIWSSMGIRAYP